jgi:hypothetical protein
MESRRLRRGRRSALRHLSRAKNMLGGDKTDRPLEGATLQGWFAPDITDDPHKGIGAWSKDGLIQYLKTGTNRWT